ncbi:hypothetical protein E4U34_000080 [Claviceps purpurea]|nr:hypothetical protein E4U34_000080 [Claviceps purpurea]
MTALHGATLYSRHFKRHPAYAYVTKVLVVTLPLGSRILLVSKSTFDSIKLGVKGVALQLAMDYQKANHKSMKIEYS